MRQAGRQERAGRSQRWIDATVHSNQREISAIISNISQAGCCIESAASFKLGELVEIVVPRLGSICGHIRWSQGYHAGAEFILGSDNWLVPDPDAAAYRAGFGQWANNPDLG